ncbi:CYTH and CHAD domain-containing protein [Cryobacterium arcticum]|uniref:CHAD domain-containing protein n=1 Tax=Cryobacterium arcticum TaxID=670052 RepID=A0A1B1BLB2_9MICO|nr:CYTH and CHAD domain-containing protein [Cryobacterium arcticum]ANP73405.1 hypothetical protein PA27867_2457 [Cryobacterium arcticum]
MTGREQTEIERKYDVVDGSQVPPLRGIRGVTAVETHDPFTLTAVYYDTDTRDLARHRIVLRRREGGGDAGWHLKTPADEGRTEVHWPLDIGETGQTGEPDDAGTVPDEVLEPVRAIVRDRALTPLARISTVRTTTHLLGPDAEPLAEVADDEVAASDARGGTYRKWREWEVELLAGAPDTRKERTRLLDAIEATLSAAGAHPSASVAKIARAVGVDSLTDLAVSPVLPGLLPSPALLDPESAAVIVVGALRDLTATLIANDPLARADAPDAVHKMRTTVRRLRSVLAVYGRLFEKTAVTELRFELKHLGIELGRVRDVEVRGARLAAELAAAAPHSTTDADIRLVGGARREHAEALDGVRGYLLSARYYRTLDALDAFAEWPPFGPKADRPAAAEIRRDLAGAVRTLAKRVDAVAGADAPEPALHEVRKAARRLRYAAEAVAQAQPVRLEPDNRAKKKTGKKAARKSAKAFDKAAARFDELRGRYDDIAGVAKPLVKRLGDRHDRQLLLDEVERAGQTAHEAGENTLVYGLLLARAEEPDDTVDVVLADARKTLRRLEKMVKAL